MKTETLKALSIQVNLNGLSFCILNTKANTIEYCNSITFDEKLSPYDVLNKLSAYLEANTIFSEAFNTITIIHQNELSTFVPKDLYNSNFKADYLKFNTKILKTDLIVSDTITINTSVNVYVPYVNINNYILEKFGEFTYKHASSIYVNSVLKNYNDTSSNVYINVNTTHFELIVKKENELQLYNYFDYTTKEDFIYYVLFVFEQLGLNTEETVVKLSGLINENDDLYTILYTYIRHIEFVKLDFNFSTSTISKEKLHHHYLILNSF